MHTHASANSILIYLFNKIMLMFSLISPHVLLIIYQTLRTDTH